MTKGEEKKDRSGLLFFIPLAAEDPNATRTNRDKIATFANAIAMLRPESCSSNLLNNWNTENINTYLQYHTRDQSSLTSLTARHKCIKTFRKFTTSDHWICVMGRLELKKGKCWRNANMSDNKGWFFSWEHAEVTDTLMCSSVFDKSFKSEESLMIISQHLQFNDGVWWCLSRQ